MLSRDANTTVVQRFVEGFWNQGDMVVADELMTADAVIFLPGQGQVSKENFKTFALTLRRAFPDWHSTPDEMIVEDGRVAERWTGRGSHLGAFQGVAPTGKQVVVPGFVFYRIVSDKITEFRGLFYGLSMLQQIGAMSAAPHAVAP